MGQYFTNEKLVSNIKKTTCFVKGKKFSFYTDNGVFSKDGLDFGSRLLLESIPLEEVGGKILDLGCGYGVIGVILNKLVGCSCDMVDVNLRALHLAQMNSDLNKCTDTNIFESNIYSNVTGRYNSIITNPPIRAGKSVVYDMLLGANDYLEENGHLFLVIRKQQGAKSLIRDLGLKYEVDVLEKAKGYFILKCSKKNSGVN
jgi:16S rRNA (guanine1207-N2)-methyltransferase